MASSPRENSSSILRFWPVPPGPEIGLAGSSVWGIPDRRLPIRPGASSTCCASKSTRLPAVSTSRRDCARHAHARVDDRLELHVIAGVLEQGVERAVAIGLIGGPVPRVADGDDPADGGVASASRAGAKQTRGWSGARNASKFTPG